MKLPNLFIMILKLLKSLKEFWNLCDITSNNKQIFEENITKGMGADLIEFILDAEKAPIALHDLKIKLTSDLHKYLIVQGYLEHKRNKMIQLEMKNEHYTTVKINVYPQTITLDIGCSNEPMTCLPAGAVRLASLLENIQRFLCEQSSHRANLDPIAKWVLTHYHKNKDGKLTYNSDRFHILLEATLGGITRAYSKKFPDGSIFVRLEEIRTERMKIPLLLKNMRISSMDVTP